MEIFTQYFFLYIKGIESFSLVILNFSLGIGSFAILAYVYLMPIKKLNFLKLPEKLYFINRKQKTYIWFALIVTYLAFIFLSILVYANYEIADSIIEKYFIFILLIPLLFLSIFILMFFIIFILLAPFKKMLKDKFKFSNNTRYEISFRLLDTLKKMSIVENVYIYDNVEFELLINELESINSLIEKFPLLYYKNTNSLVEQEFSKSSNAFKNIICDIMYMDMLTLPA